MGAVCSVDIETWGGVGKIGTDLLEDLVPALAGFGARGISVGAGGIAGGPGATFLVEADARSPAESMALAASRGVRWFMDACEKVGLDHGGIARIDLMTDSYLDRYLAQEPETYVGVSEIADLLKVSRQRVAELRTRADFPAPVAELAAGPVWSRSSLNRFVESWDRKPGRPRRQATGSVRSA